MRGNFVPPLHCHRRRNWRVSGAAILLVSLLSPWTAAAQTPANTPANTPAPAPEPSRRDVPIRPSAKLRDELNMSQSKTDLLMDLERLQTQQEVGARELAELRKELQGTPGWAIDCHHLAIILEQDWSDILTLLGGHIECHRHNLDRDRKRQQIRLTRSENDLREVTLRIERLADQLLAKRDDAGEELLDEQIADHKALMHQLILRRNDQKRYEEQYRKNIEFDDAELRELSKLDKHVTALSRQRAEYMSRLTDAIEHAQDSLVTEDVRQSRIALRRFENAMRARPDAAKTDVIASDQPLREGLLPGSASSDSRPLVPETTPALPPDAEQLIEEELKKAEARAKPAPQP